MPLVGPFNLVNLVAESGKRLPIALLIGYIRAHSLQFPALSKLLPPALPLAQQRKPVSTQNKRNRKVVPRTAPPSPRVSTRLRRAWRQAWALREHPKGWTAGALRSRIAPLGVRVLALLPIIYGSGPDSWKQNPGLYIGALVLLTVVAELVRTLVHGAEKSAQSEIFQRIGSIVSLLAGSRRGEPSITENPSAAIELLLRRAKEVVTSGLKPAAGDIITANLLLPVANSRGKVIGLQATTHDDFYADRTHEIIPLDAPGAGEAFCEGKWTVVEDTEEIANFERIRGRAYRSIAAFPIIVQPSEGEGVVTAVVTFDSTNAYTFKRRSVRQVAPFVHPIAQLIGLALKLRDQG